TPPRKICVWRCNAPHGRDPAAREELDLPRWVVRSKGAVSLCPEQHGGVHFLLGTHDPAPASVVQYSLLAWLGGRTELELHVDPPRLLAAEQLLLERLPVRGVVDVAGDVELGGAEAPRRAARASRRPRVRERVA